MKNFIELINQANEEIDTITVEELAKEMVQNDLKILSQNDKKK